MTDRENLLELAKSGKSRPHSRTKLGRVLCRYTSKNGKGFDSEFDKQIRKLAPMWFQEQRRNYFKSELLKLAKSGAARPHLKSELGVHLAIYTWRSNRCFDEKFAMQLKGLRPEWFVGRGRYARKPRL